jgi:alpha-1,2-mannosyltransferase
MHTMKHEHFGIAIVELMSSGIITVAHNSAGPKLDIIGGAKKDVGFLADDLEGYAFYVHKALIGFDTEKMKQLR